MGHLQPNRVQRPPPLHRQLPEPERLCVDGALWFHPVVLVPAEEQHRRAPQKQACRQEVREPKPNISLGIDHAHLAGDGTNVDSQVVVQVDPLDGDGWVHDHPFPGGKGLDVWILLAILLGDEG